MAGVATALRVVATGSTWAAIEVPLVVVAAAALPRRHALTASSAALMPLAGALVGVVGLGTRAASDVLTALLPLAVVPAAAVVALAWRRRALLLEGRLERAENAARDVAVRDQLTGAVNRIGLELVAGPLIHHARRQGEAAHCLFVDVDGFRDLNEAAGPTAADDVLRAIAVALLGAVRSTDSSAAGPATSSWWSARAPAPRRSSSSGACTPTLPRCRRCHRDLDPPGQHRLGHAGAVGRGRPRVAAAPGRPGHAAAAVAAPPAGRPGRRQRRAPAAATRRGRRRAEKRRALARTDLC